MDSEGGEQSQVPLYFYEGSTINSANSVVVVPLIFHVCIPRVLSLEKARVFVLSAMLAEVALSGELTNFWRIFGSIHARIVRSGDSTPIGIDMEL